MTTAARKPHPAAAKRRPKRFPLRVIKGGFAPADRITQSILRDRGYHVGDIVFAEIRKPRRPRFHRLAHVFGGMVAENIEGFENLDNHRVLKRLQWESGIGCDEMRVQLDGGAQALVRAPQSLGFESMDDGEFREVFLGLCRHVSHRYWPALTAEQIADMAEAMVDE